MTNYRTLYNGNEVRGKQCFCVSVPPSAVIIYDEEDSERKTFVGPYQEGDSMSLHCQAYGGNVHTVDSPPYNKTSLTMLAGVSRGPNIEEK